MRLYESQSTSTNKKSLKRIKPLNPQQARIASLKRNAESAKQAYKAEKDRQKIANAQQQIFKATH